MRTAVAADASSVLDLEAGLFGPEAWSLATVVQELTGPHRQAVVAVADGSVVGYATTMRAGEVVDLQRIAVDPDRRREGIARALLAEVVDRGRAAGARRMLLEVSALNPDGLAFYAVEGFVEIDRRRRYYRDGSDAVVMSRPLVSPAGADEGKGRP